MITHVVMFKLRDNSADHVRHCKALLDGLVGEIDEIREWSVGVDVVRSPRSWDLVLVSAFDGLDALQRYQVHEKHVDVATYLVDASEARASVDFET